MRTLILVVVAALALAGCTSNADDKNNPTDPTNPTNPTNPTGPTTPAANESKTINIERLMYSPTPLEVPVGTNVTWVNKDLVAHTATATGKFDTGNIDAGKSKSLVLSTAGTYDYVCKIHPTMSGKITVK